MLQLHVFQEPVLMQHPHYQNPLAVILNVRLSYKIVFGMVNRQGDVKTSIRLALVLLEVLHNVANILNKDALNLQIKNPNTVNQHLVIHMDWTPHKLRMNNKSIARDYLILLDIIVMLMVAHHVKSLKLIFFRKIAYVLLIYLWAILIMKRIYFARILKYQLFNVSMSQGNSNAIIRDVQITQQLEIHLTKRLLIVIQSECIKLRAMFNVF